MTTDSDLAEVRAQLTASTSEVVTLRFKLGECEVDLAAAQRQLESQLAHSVEEGACWLSLLSCLLPVGSSSLCGACTYGPDAPSPRPVDRTRLPYYVPLK